MNIDKPTFTIGQLEQFVHLLHEAIVVTNQQLQIIIFNSLAENMFDYKQSEVLNKPIEILLPTELRHRRLDFLNLDDNTKPDPMQRPCSLWGLRKNKTQFPIEISISKLEVSAKSLLLIVIHDETSDYERQKRYQYRAEHDLLTGLCNRTCLLDTLDNKLKQATRKTHLALFFIDLDNFKPINDTLGHAVGDKLLTIVARRISSAVRANDIVCRFGGDEFVLLLANYLSLQQLKNIADNILISLNKTINIHTNRIHISASIGIARYPENGKQAHELLNSADIAMYKAKKTQNTYYLAAASVES